MKMCNGAQQLLVNEPDGSERQQGMRNNRQRMTERKGNAKQNAANLTQVLSLSRHKMNMIDIIHLAEICFGLQPNET